MNSYLWIGGTIQPDTTRPRGRGRLRIVGIAALLIALVLAAAIVKARAAPSGRSTPAARLTAADRAG